MYSAFIENYSEKTKKILKKSIDKADFSRYNNANDNDYR